MKNRLQMMERCMRFMKKNGSSELTGEKYCGPHGMFKSVMGDTPKDDALETYGTPELRSLFNDWLLQLEEEITTLLEQCEAVTPEAVAESLKISVESATFILDKLAQR
jgi:hypothetical protein